MLVIHDTSKPESTIKKKCNVIACHAIHESVKMRETLTKYIMLGDSIADLLKSRHWAEEKGSCVKSFK